MHTLHTSPLIYVFYFYLGIRKITIAGSSQGDKDFLKESLREPSVNKLNISRETAVHGVFSTVI